MQDFFSKIKLSLTRRTEISAKGTPSNMNSITITHNCAKFGAFVSCVTIKLLRDLTNRDYERIKVSLAFENTHG